MHVSTIAKAIFVFPSSRTIERTYKRSWTVVAWPSRNPPAMMAGSLVGVISTTAAPARKGESADATVEFVIATVSRASAWNKVKRFGGIIGLPGGG